MREGVDTVGGGAEGLRERLARGGRGKGGADLVVGLHHAHRASEEDEFLSREMGLARDEGSERRANARDQLLVLQHRPEPLLQARLRLVRRLRLGLFRLLLLSQVMRTKQGHRRKHVAVLLRTSAR